jgi:hypothetical protein
MGTVFLALDEDDRRVAVKVINADLSADPEFRARFADEVAAARRVAPFCTAQVLDADPYARQPYLVTEFIEGRRLDQVVAESGPLVLSTLQGVAVGVASALTAIHGAGVVHRDLKPTNVLLSFSGPRVIDFGIARALDAVTGRTRTGLVLGSAGWMAPEQMEGAPVGPAADVFAWGLLVAYAAAGLHPYGEGTYLELSERVLTGRPDTSGVPADLRRVVDSALVRDPRLRPSAEQVLLALLGDAGRGGNVRAAATEVIDGTWPGRGGRAAGLAAAGLAGGGLAGGGAVGRRLDPTKVASTGSEVRTPRWPGAAGAGPNSPRARAEPRGGAAGNAGHRRRGGYVRYGDDDAGGGRPPQPAAAGRGGPPAARYAPPPATYRPPPPPYGGRAPAAPFRPAPRRRRRLRIPFKKTIIFVLLVLFLLSAADRIATMADKQRQRVWDKIVTSVHDEVKHQLDQLGGKANDLRDQVGGSQRPQAG